MIDGDAVSLMPKDDDELDVDDDEDDVDDETLDALLLEGGATVEISRPM